MEWDRIRGQSLSGWWSFRLGHHLCMASHTCAHCLPYITHCTLFCPFYLQTPCWHPCITCHPIHTAFSCACASSPLLFLLHASCYFCLTITSCVHYKSMTGHFKQHAGWLACALNPLLAMAPCPPPLPAFYLFLPYPLLPFLPSYAMPVP